MVCPAVVTTSLNKPNINYQVKANSSSLEVFTPLVEEPKKRYGKNNTYEYTLL